MQSGSVVLSQTSGNLAERHILMGQRGAGPSEDDTVTLAECDIFDRIRHIVLIESTSDFHKDSLRDRAVRDQHVVMPLTEVDQLFGSIGAKFLEEADVFVIREVVRGISAGVAAEQLPKLRVGLDRRIDPFDDFEPACFVTGLVEGKSNFSGPARRGVVDRVEHLTVQLFNECLDLAASKFSDWTEGLMQRVWCCFCVTVASKGECGGIHAVGVGVG